MRCGRCGSKWEEEPGCGKVIHLMLPSLKEAAEAKPGRKYKAQTPSGGVVKVWVRKDGKWEAEGYGEYETFEDMADSLWEMGEAGEEDPICTRELAECAGCAECVKEGT